MLGQLLAELLNNEFVDCKLITIKLTIGVGQESWVGIIVQALHQLGTMYYYSDYRPLGWLVICSLVGSSGFMQPPRWT